MVDHTKWDTSQVLVNGVLQRPAPDIKCPQDAVLADVDEENIAPDTLRKGLESGGLTASMYYGCWRIWKTASGFSGELLQYLNVTDRFENLPTEEALDKAGEWISACYG